MLRRFEESVYDFFLCQRTLYQLHSDGRRLPREMNEIIARKIMMEQWMREPITILIDNVDPDEEEPVTIHLEWVSSRDTPEVIKYFLCDIHKRQWFNRQLWITLDDGRCTHRELMYIGKHLKDGDHGKCEWLDWQCRSVLLLKKRARTVCSEQCNAGHDSDTMGLHIVLGEF